MARITYAVLLSLALSACGDMGGEQRNDVAKVEIANPVSDQIKAGDALFQAVALRRPIVDQNRRCKKVEAGGYQQQYKNYAMWTAHCSDTGDWAVFIAPTGDAEARPCADLAKLKIPPCGPVPAFAQAKAVP